MGSDVASEIAVALAKAQNAARATEVILDAVKKQLPPDVTELDQAREDVEADLAERMRRREARALLLGSMGGLLGTALLRIAGLGPLGDFLRVVATTIETPGEDRDFGELAAAVRALAEDLR